MASCRLWFWENKMKLLQIVALVYAFLLTLLEKESRKRSKACSDRAAIEQDSGAETCQHCFAASE
jgi:hypothetical protein